MKTRVPEKKGRQLHHESLLVQAYELIYYLIVVANMQIFITLTLIMKYSRLSFGLPCVTLYSLFLYTYRHYIWTWSTSMIVNGNEYMSINEGMGHGI